MQWVWRILLSSIVSAIWVYLVANWVKPVVHDLTLRLPYNDVITDVWTPILVLVGVLVIAHRSSLFLDEDISPKTRITFILVTFGVSLLVSMVLLIGPLGALPNYDTLVALIKYRVPAI